MARDLDRLKKVLKRFGLEYKMDRNHAGVYKKGDSKRLVVCSGSGSDGYWWKQVIRDLIRYGHIPKGRYF